MLKSRIIQKYHLLLIVGIVTVVGIAATFSTYAAPSVTVVSSTATPVVGEPVTFTATVVCDVPPCQVSWRWYNTGFGNIGNGTTMGFGPSISYAFPANATGVKAVVAKITNSSRRHNSRTGQVNVQVMPVPAPTVVPTPVPTPLPTPVSTPVPTPVPTVSAAPAVFAASFTYSPTAPTAGQVITLDGSASTCITAACRYQWRWFRPGVNGQPSTDRLGTTLGEGQILPVNFPAGVYNVQLKVTASNGTNNFRTDSKYITVAP